MRLLAGTDIESFVTAKRAAAIHFDTEWDESYRTIVRGKMEDAERALGEQTPLGEVDCDSNLELAKSIPVLNVPLVAYYRNGRLVAALIGAQQNILGRLERVLRDQPIGYDDGNDGCSLFGLLS
jgi:thioredoxin-like negative regulator of GroEL